MMNIHKIDYETAPRLTTDSSPCKGLQHCSTRFYKPVGMLNGVVADVTQRIVRYLA